MILFHSYGGFQGQYLFDASFFFSLLFFVQYKVTAREQLVLHQTRSFFFFFRRVYVLFVPDRLHLCCRLGYLSFDHKRHCDVAQINTQRYTHSSSTSSSTSSFSSVTMWARYITIAQSPWRQLFFLTSNLLIALAAVSTVENSRVIVSRVLSLSW